MSLLPDLPLSRRFLTAHPPPGEVLLCAVTGSHHYGFPSPDSDIDIKGIHLAPTERFLGLTPTASPHDRLKIFEDVECDLTTHEAGQAMTLLLKGNGNMLERIFSPFQVVETDALPELRALAAGSLSRACAGHYRGYFSGMQREHLRDGRVKSLLYTFRVAMTGLHLLTTGEVVADLPTLAPRYGLPELLGLVERKRGGDEKAPLPADVSERFRALWPELDERLVQARDGSPLPVKPTNRADIEAWLVDRRRRALI